MTSITAAAPQFLVANLNESLSFSERHLGFSRDFVYEDVDDPDGYILCFAEAV